MGEAPCAVSSEGHGRRGSVCQKGWTGQEDMGGMGVRSGREAKGFKKKKRVVMHRGRGWWAVHFSPTP